jgi:hypothetical protein
MAVNRNITKSASEPSGRFSTAPSLVIARQICSNDTASAATAASYRYESRVRELQQRFEVELQGVRDAYLQELAGLDLEEQ